MPSISIVATSDPVCPFCYIALRRLDRALSLFRKTVPGASSTPLTITWRAFQLDPSAPRRVSQPWAEKAAFRRGPDAVPALQKRLADVGARDGVVFDFDCRIGNTIEAHRLGVLARRRGVVGDDDGREGEGEGLEHRVVRETMRVYFEQGGDITSVEDLVRGAERAGLDAEEARAWLEGDDGLEEVQREVAEAVGMRIKGVPRFVINGKFVVEGADDVGAFFEQLVLAKEELDQVESV